MSSVSFYVCQWGRTSLADSLFDLHGVIAAAILALDGFAFDAGK